MRSYADKSTIKRDGIVLVWLLAMSTLAVVMLLYRDMQVTGDNYRFMVWNLFLAWIPCALSFMLAVAQQQEQKGRVRGKRGLLWWIVAGVWLLFYPNAPYMLTDLIHLNRISFIVWDGYYQVYHRSLLAWYDLVTLTIFIGVGLVLSCISLRHMHDQFRIAWGKWKARALMGIVIILAGYGVFLGRFLRLNSWDVRRFDQLLEQMLGEINRQTLGFVCIFSLVIALCYITYCLIDGGAAGKANSRKEGEGRHG